METELITREEKTPGSFEVTLQIKAKHAALLKAARKMGGASKLAKHLDIPYCMLMSWISMRKMPAIGKAKSKIWGDSVKSAEIEQKLFAITGQTLDELFPECIRSKDFLDHQKNVEITGAICPSRLSLKHEEVAKIEYRDIEADESDEQSELKSRVKSVLKSLSHNEREVIKLRYGIDSEEEMSLREIGKKLKVGPERIRQIESKAMNKLQSGIRRDKLKPFVDIDFREEVLQEN